VRKTIKIIFIVLFSFTMMAWGIGLKKIYFNFTFNGWGTSTLCEKYFNDIFNNFENDLKVPLKSPILDIGCGFGTASYNLARRGIDNIVALDISKEHIGYLIKNLPQDIPNIENKIKPIVGDFLSLSNLTKDSFKTVIIFDVFHMLTGEKIEKFLKKSYSILEPGGYLVLKWPVNTFKDEYDSALQKYEALRLQGKNHVEALNIVLLHYHQNINKNKKDEYKCLLLPSSLDSKNLKRMVLYPWECLPKDKFYSYKSSDPIKNTLLLWPLWEVVRLVGFENIKFGTDSIDSNYLTAMKPKSN